MHPVRSFRAAITNLLASLVAVIAIAPIYLLFANALKTQSDANSMSPEPPLNLQWSNFTTVLDQGGLVTAFLNSALYAFGSTILGVLVAALAAYVLARRPKRWVLIIFFMLIIGHPIRRRRHT